MTIPRTPKEQRLAEVRFYYPLSALCPYCDAVTNFSPSYGAGAGTAVREYQCHHCGKASELSPSLLAEMKEHG